MLLLFDLIPWELFGIFQLQRYQLLLNASWAPSPASNIWWEETHPLSKPLFEAQKDNTKKDNQHTEVIFKFAPSKGRVL